MYDEPFADSSQIPTSLVTKMARQHVTVALSGDGGDELFGGYSRYFRVNNWWQKCERMPAFLRHPAGALLSASTHLPGKGAWRGKVGKLGELLRRYAWRVLPPVRVLLVGSGPRGQGGVEPSPSSRAPCRARPSSP